MPYSALKHSAESLVETLTGGTLYTNFSARMIWYVVGAATIDPRLTRMALENLRTNAVKYTPAGGRVRFSARVQYGRLSCEVADTGCGIPKEEQAQLFTKLFRASNVRDRMPGNGFGLYIAKGAIEQQGVTFSSTARLIVARHSSSSYRRSDPQPGIRRASDLARKSSGLSWRPARNTGRCRRC